MCVTASSVPFLLFSSLELEGEGTFPCTSTTVGWRQAVLVTPSSVSPWNASSPDRFARQEWTPITFALNRMQAAHTPTNHLGLFPSSTPSWQGSVQQFQLGSPAPFSPVVVVVVCSSDWRASKASRELGTWRDNSAFLWSAACLEARPLLGEVMRLSELDQMAIWD